MKRDYQKITGHATYGVDGKLLEDIVGENAGTITIVEAGTQYGRHAVLWSQILEEKKCKAKHVLVDSTDYLGHEFAQDYAEQRLREFECKQSIKKVDTLETGAKNFEDETVDVLFVDAIVGASKLTNILQAWTPKITTGGKLIYHSYTSVINEDDAMKIIETLVATPFAIEVVANLIVCTKQEQHTKKTEPKTRIKPGHVEDGN